MRKERDTEEMRSVETRTTEITPRTVHSVEDDRSGASEGENSEKENEDKQEKEEGDASEGEEEGKRSEEEKTRAKSN